MLNVIYMITIIIDAEASSGKYYMYIKMGTCCDMNMDSTLYPIDKLGRVTNLLANKVNCRKPSTSNATCLAEKQQCYFQFFGLTNSWIK